MKKIIATALSLITLLSSGSISVFASSENDCELNTKKSTKSMSRRFISEETKVRIREEFAKVKKDNPNFTQKRICEIVGNKINVSISSVLRYNDEQSYQNYLEKNKEKRLETARLYKEKNKEKIKEYAKQYYKNHKEKYKEKCKQSYKKNKEKRQEYKKRYYRENKEKIRKSAKKYYKKNKESMNREIEKKKDLDYAQKLEKLFKLL